MGYSTLTLCILSNLGLYSGHCECYIVQTLDSVVLLQRVLIFKVSLDSKCIFSLAMVCGSSGLKSDHFQYILHMCSSGTRQKLKQSLHIEFEVLFLLSPFSNDHPPPAPTTIAFGSFSYFLFLEVW